MTNKIVAGFKRLCGTSAHSPEIGKATVIAPKLNKYRQTWGKRVIPNAVIDTSMIPVEFKGPCCLS